MTPFLKRNLLIPVAVILFAVLLYSIGNFIPALGNRVQHLEFIVLSVIVSISIIVMLFWTLLGVFGGLASLLVAMIFLYRPMTGLNPYYYSDLTLAFFLSSFIGYYSYRKINTSNQEYTVTSEKIQEDTNLISNHFQNREAEVVAMGEKVNGLLKLQNIADKLSLSLSEDDIVRIVSERTYEIFGKDMRVLLFTTGDFAKELVLSFSLKSDKRKAAVTKTGGIFDRWALKNMKSLLVKDVKKDYRFSVSGEEADDDAVSLILKPLIIENTVLGILRVDSSDEEAFGQHELRMLDIIGELAAVSLENARLYRRTEELAIRDSLTGLYVHRYFMERMDEEVKRSLRADKPFALLMIDIDNFKGFNDEHGHVAGDAILKKIGKTLQSRASGGDIVARYGGEEFAFVALDCTRKDAIQMAEDIRKDTEKSTITMRRKKYGVTISVGVAMFPKDAKLREDIIGEADRQLYSAKKKGKNKVCSK